MNGRHRRGRRGGLGLFLLAALGVAALAAINRRDIERYMRIRSM